MLKERFLLRHGRLALPAPTNQLRAWGPRSERSALCGRRRCLHLAHLERRLAAATASPSLFIWALCYVGMHQGANAGPDGVLGRMQFQSSQQGPIGAGSYFSIETYPVPTCGPTQESSNRSAPPQQPSYHASGPLHEADSNARFLPLYFPLDHAIHPHQRPNAPPNRAFWTLTAAAS